MPSDPVILAFDTSAAHCAAALLSGDRVIASHHEDMARGQAERLFPLLEEMLQSAGLGWSDLDAIGVGVGPGNFTGIRISVAAARGLRLSLGIPAVGVSALEAAAHGLDRPVTALIDARRGRVYAQRFPGGSPELIEAGSLPDGPVTGPGASGGRPATCPLAVAIARIAAQRFSDNPPPPAPLYLRPADAAPATDTGPAILDA